MMQAAQLHAVIIWSFSAASLGLKCVPDYSFSHPLDCKSYYLCGEDRERHLFECPGELLYNELKKACDWPNNVNCDLLDKFAKLKSDIRLLEYVKKDGLAAPIFIVSTDSPILASILDAEQKCVDVKENHTGMMKQVQEIASQCGDAVVPYIYKTLDEIEEKYNLSHVLEVKGNEEVKTHLAGIFQYWAPDDNVKYYQDNKQIYGSSNSEGTMDVYSDILDKRQTDLNESFISMGDSAEFLYRTRLVIDGEDANSNSTASKEEIYGVNSPTEGNNTEGFPIKYKPIFPILNNSTRKMQMDVLGYEASNETACEGETCVEHFHSLIKSTGSIQ